MNNKKIDLQNISFVEQNKALLQEIIPLLEQLEAQNVYCRVQYKTREHHEKIKSKSKEICERLKEYGFFKKRSKKKYYRISDTYLILNYA